MTFFLLNNHNVNELLAEINYCGSKRGNEEEKNANQKKK